MNYRENQFVFEYLVDYNATQAAIRAGYSERSAGAIGHELLKKPKILEAVAAAAEGRLERAKINADYVLERLLEIDQMDIADILTDGGELLPPNQWPKVWRTYISGMDLAELFEGQGSERELVGVLKKIKWPDKVRNLELLGKHVTVAAFRERLALTDGDDGDLFSGLADAIRSTTKNLTLRETDES